jgi:hypothetical protein
MQNVVGFDIGKETLAVCHAPCIKDQHMEVGLEQNRFSKVAQKL